jgi:hypothetical protein
MWPAKGAAGCRHAMGGLAGNQVSIWVIPQMKYLGCFAKAQQGREGAWVVVVERGGQGIGVGRRWPAREGARRRQAVMIRQGAGSALQGAA